MTTVTEETQGGGSGAGAPEGGDNHAAALEAARKIDENSPEGYQARIHLVNQQFSEHGPQAALTTVEHLYRYPDNQAVALGALLQFELAATEGPDSRPRDDSIERHLRDTLATLQPRDVREANLGSLANTHAILAIEGRLEDRASVKSEKTQNQIDLTRAVAYFEVMEGLDTPNTQDEREAARHIVAAALHIGGNEAAASVIADVNERARDVLTKELAGMAKNGAQVEEEPKNTLSPELQAAITALDSDSSADQQSARRLLIKTMYAADTSAEHIEAIQNALNEFNARNEAARLRGDLQFLAPRVEAMSGGRSLAVAVNGPRTNGVNATMNDPDTLKTYSGALKALLTGTLNPDAEVRTTNENDGTTTRSWPLSEYPDVWYVETTKPGASDSDSPSVTVTLVHQLPQQN